MKVKELIPLLQQCDPDSTVESFDGTDVVQVARHSGMKRVALSREDEELAEENLGSGWEIVK